MEKCPHSAALLPLYSRLARGLQKQSSSYLLAQSELFQLCHTIRKPRRLQHPNFLAMVDFRYNLSGTGLLDFLTGGTKKETTVNHADSSVYYSFDIYL